MNTNWENRLVHFGRMSNAAGGRGEVTNGKDTSVKGDLRKVGPPAIGERPQSVTGVC